MEKHGIKTVRTDGHWDANRRRYSKAVAELEAIGMSLSRTVEVSAVGFHHFEVSISPDEFYEMSEATFVREFEDAIADLVTDHQTQLFELKRTHLRT